MLITSQLLPDGDEAERRLKALQTFALIVSITFIYAARTAMSIWACTELADGNKYLDASPDMQCGQPGTTWALLCFASILFFLINIGFIFFLLRLEKAEETAIVSKSFKDDNFKMLDVLHHFTSGIKAIGTDVAYKGMDELRQACGGASSCCLLSYHGSKGVDIC